MWDETQSQQAFEQHSKHGSVPSPQELLSSVSSEGQSFNEIFEQTCAAWGVFSHPKIKLSSIEKQLADEEESKKPNALVHVSGWKMDSSSHLCMLATLLSPPCSEGKIPRELKLQHVALSKCDIALLAKTLPLTPIRVLYLDFNRGIGWSCQEEDEELEFLPLLQPECCSKLVKLSLRGNHLSDAEATSLLQLVEGNDSIRSLSLDMNNIDGTESASLLATILRTNRTLQFVTLSHNPLTDDAVASILGILAPFPLSPEESKNKKLKAALGACEVIDGQECCTGNDALRFLNLSSTNAGPQTIAQLARIFDHVINPNSERGYQPPDSLSKLLVHVRGCGFDTDGSNLASVPNIVCL